MHQISPGGFALALVLLAVIWIFLPPKARVPLAIILIMAALASTQAPVHTIQRLTEYLK